ncbi:uncharacterized protein [Branchiostoma lanceolatum]|uniref:Hypp2812 protein n=1 Tax=Branchiostoma lanceolatum TaxID=7740 RepID=A0A8K0EPN8_BRALA|nr:Hypp2812 [Branchiostoma lanceolatum]
MASPSLYWLEYSFAGSEQTPLTDLIKGTVHALTKAMLQTDQGKVLFVFKVLAEPKIIVVIQSSTPTDLDTALTANPVPSLGRLVQVKCRPLRQYEAFASEVLGVEWAGPKTHEWSSSPTEGFIYWIDMYIGYSGLKQQQLFDVWRKEAMLVLQTVGSGNAQLFKVLAERRVMMFLKASSPDMLDNVLYKLPLIQHLGDQVQLVCKPVVPYTYEDFTKSNRKNDVNRKV